MNRPPEPTLPLSDRGLAYGDGLFETVLVRDGTPLLWSEHLARLLKGCRVLDLPPPRTEALASALAGAGPGLGVLKLVYTRGSGGRGYAPPASSDPRLEAVWSSFAPDQQRWAAGVRVRRCRLRLARQPVLAGIKHLARLENVLARAEWRDPDIAEGLLEDDRGQLVEATAMNVFFLARGAEQVSTPPLDQCGVAGTLRAALLEQGAVVEAPLLADELSSCEALWLGNSVQGVWPVARLDDSEGQPQHGWELSDVHRAFQHRAHRLLGYAGAD